MRACVTASRVSPFDCFACVLTGRAALQVPPEAAPEPEPAPEPELELNRWSCATCVAAGVSAPGCQVCAAELQTVHALRKDVDSFIDMMSAQRLRELMDQLRQEAAASSDADPDLCTVHVGGLDNFTEARMQSSYEAELTQLFQDFGAVLAVQVRIRNRVEADGQKKVSWALVTYSTAAEAGAAIAGGARLSLLEQSRTHRLQGCPDLGAHSTH